MNRKKTILVTLTTILLLGILGATYYLYSHNSGGANVTPTPDTEIVRPKVPEPNNSPKSDADATINKTPQQYSTPVDSQPPKNTITGTITGSTYSGGKLSIRTSIDQAIPSGTCSLTLSNGSVSITDSAPVIQETSYSTCQGFDITSSKLTPGKWTIRVNISSGDKSGTLTGEITL